MLQHFQHFTSKFDVPKASNCFTGMDELLGALWDGPHASNAPHAIPSSNHVLHPKPTRLQPKTMCFHPQPTCLHPQRGKTRGNRPCLGEQEDPTALPHHPEHPLLRLRSPCILPGNILIPHCAQGTTCSLHPKKKTQLRRARQWAPGLFQLAGMSSKPPAPKKGAPPPTTLSPRVPHTAEGGGSRRLSCLSWML